MLKGAKARLGAVVVHGVGAPASASSPSQGIARPARHQSSAHQVEIGQGEHSKGTNRVLVDAAVTYLGEAPQSLDDEERVLAKGAPARTATVDRLLVGAQLRTGFRPAVDSVADARLLTVLAVILAPVGLIAIQFFFLAMNQIAQPRDVSLVGRTRSDTVDQALLA